MTTEPTLAQFIPPIALATVVNVFLFAWAWQGHRAEKREGKPPKRYEAAVVAYLAAVGLFAYARLARPSGGWLDMLGVAFIAEAMGAGITFALFYAFLLTRGRAWRDRAFPMAAAVFFVGLMIAGLLAS